MGLRQEFTVTKGRNFEISSRYRSRSCLCKQEKSSTTGAMVGRQSFGGWKDSGTTGKGTGGRYYLTQFMREQSQTVVE